MILKIKEEHSVSNTIAFVKKFNKEKEYEQVTGAKFTEETAFDFGADSDIISEILSMDKKPYVFFYDEEGAGGLGAFNIYEFETCSPSQKKKGECIELVK